MEHSPILPPGGPVESVERFLSSNIGIEPLSAVARAVSQFSREQLGSAIEVLIALLDVADGDADAQDTSNGEDEGLTGLSLTHADKGPGCLASDPGDVSYTEWHTRGRFKLTLGIYGTDGRTLREDDEMDDQPEEDEAAEDDDADAEDDGREDGHDSEREQMHDDVPALPVWSLDYNIFNDKRTYLGRSNLLTSFRSNGGGELSADTGATLVTRGRPDKPGVPV